MKPIGESVRLYGRKRKVRVVTKKELHGGTAETDIREVTIKQFNDLPKDDSGRIYASEYALDLIGQDKYIMDMRDWPNGITEREVRKRFESGEWQTNSGHFNYVMRGYRIQGGTFEDLWAAFKKHMVDTLRYHIEWYTETLEKYKKSRAESESKGLPPDDYVPERIENYSRSIVLCQIHLNIDFWKSNMCKRETVEKHCRRRGVEDVTEIINGLIREGVLYEPKSGYISFT